MRYDDGNPVSVVVVSLTASAPLGSNSPPSFKCVSWSLLVLPRFFEPLSLQPSGGEAVSLECLLVSICHVAQEEACLSPLQRASHFSPVTSIGAVDLQRYRAIEPLVVCSLHFN